MRESEPGSWAWANPAPEQLALPFEEAVALRAREMAKFEAGQRKQPARVEDFPAKARA